MPASEETGKTILVVEDVFMVRRTLEMTLKRGGYRVLEASDARKAMDILKQGVAVDLVTLDIMMPEVDGLQLAQVLKKYGPTKGIPLMMCSARGDEPTVAEARRIGAVDFIVKPFTPEIVLKKVDTALGVVRRPPVEEKPGKKKGATTRGRKGRKGKTAKKTARKKKERPAI